MTTTIKTSIPAKRMNEGHISKITHRIANMAMEPERKALVERQQSIVARLTDCMDAAVTDAMIAALPEGYRPPRQCESVDFNYTHDGVYVSRAYFSFTPTRPVYYPVQRRYMVWPAEAMSIFPADLIEEAKRLSVAFEDAERRFRDLRMELKTNLEAARTVRNACQLWPEAKDVILEVTDIAAEVEVPLEAILGRYLKALPAPASETGQPEASDGDDAANDNATDDVTTVEREIIDIAAAAAAN